jgi:methyl-accepting chemotaxis protein
MKNPSDTLNPASSLLQQSFPVVLRWLLPALAGAGYLVGLALGLGPVEALGTRLLLLLPVLAVGGALLPWAALRHVVNTQLPAEAQGAERVRRLMELPWRLAAASVTLPGAVMGGAYALALALVSGKSVLLVGSGLLVGLAAGVALAVPVALQLERQLLPALVEEQAKLGQQRPEGYGLFWLRRSSAPYAVLGAALALALPLPALVAGAQASRAHEAQLEALRANAALSAEQVALVTAQLEGLRGSLALGQGAGLVLLSLFTLVLAGLGARRLAERQARGFEALQASLASLKTGTPEAPRWSSPDELGALSVGLADVLQRIREFPTALESVTNLLTGASSSLGEAGDAHRQSMMKQDSALQEAQVTTQEVKQTSALAARRVEAVLKVVSRAEALGSTGEAALEQTLTGLKAIREFTEGIRSRVVHVQKCALQISDIAFAVKELASQSNVLSINAAIEANRLGEQGLGAAVVAQELRALTDQSIRETVRIRRVLHEVGSAILELVSMSEDGAQQVESGLGMVKSSADSLREMSAIIRENASAARMIAMAVNQQDTGISHVFTAISQLGRGMNDAMQRMEHTLDATRSLENISEQLQSIASRYQPNAQAGGAASVAAASAGASTPSGSEASN